MVNDGYPNNHNNEPIQDNQSTLLASSIAPPDAPATFEVQNGAAPAVVIGSSNRARNLVQNLQMQQRQVSEQEQMTWNQ